MSDSSNSNPEGSARLDSAFQRALAKFKTDSLTEKEGDEFQWGTLDELKASIEKIQDEQVSNNKNRNLNRVNAFLEGMQQYEEIIKVFLNTCNYLAFVWVCPGGAQLSPQIRTLKGLIIRFPGSDEISLASDEQLCQCFRCAP